MRRVPDKNDNLPEDELRGITAELTDVLDRLVKARVAELERSPERRLLSKHALAEHLGVMPRTLKTWREKGCPALRVGRVLMFNVEEVNRWLEQEGEA